MDGHSSHYQPEIIQLARENDVVILCFPPYTSADSQPLDVGFFRPLKTPMGQAGIIPSTPSTSLSGTFTTPSTSQSVTNPSTPSTSQSTTSSVTPSTSQSTNSSVTASTSPLANYLVRPVPVTPKSRNPLKQSLELEF